MRGFHNSSFDPQTLVLLETAFDEAWLTLKSVGNRTAHGAAKFWGFVSNFGRHVRSILFSGPLIKSQRTLYDLWQALPVLSWTFQNFCPIFFSPNSPARAMACPSRFGCGSHVTRHRAVTSSLWGCNALRFRLRKVCDASRSRRRHCDASPVPGRVS